jgi:DNA-binding MarR family transcriptional regulator
MKNTELASALRTITSKLYKRLRKQMHTVDNLSITEVTTLSNLYHNTSLFPSEMAEMAKVKAQSMSHIINRLEEAQLINKTPSQTDKRKVAISLTDLGKLKVEQSRYERDEWLDNAIEHHLSADEKKLLKDAIKLMDKLADYK